MATITDLPDELLVIIAQHAALFMAFQCHGCALFSRYRCGPETWRNQGAFELKWKPRGLCTNCKEYILFRGCGMMKNRQLCGLMWSQVYYERALLNLRNNSYVSPVSPYFKGDISTLFAHNGYRLAVRIVDTKNV